MRSLLALAALLALAQGGLTQSKSDDVLFPLRWKPKVGEVHVYHVNVKFDYGEAAMEFKSDLRVKVTAVADDGGYTVQTSTTGASINSGSETRDLPLQSPETEYYSSLGLPKGHSLLTRDPDPFSDLLEHLTEFQAPSRPVRVRGSWTNRPVGPKTSLFGQPRISYTLVDAYHDGARHLAKVRYQAAVETDPFAASGTIILDRSNNYLAEVDATIPHFKPPDAKEEAAVTISVKEKS